MIKPTMSDYEELNQRFESLERQLKLVVSNTSASNAIDVNRNDEIDLRVLFNILWQGKWWITSITFLFALVGVLYAFSLPNMYTSKGIYSPAQKNGGSSSMSAQLGGLASLAGVSLGAAETNDIDQVMELIVSWPFLGQVISKHDLKPLILAAVGWDSSSRKIIWDRERYDPDAKRWLSLEGETLEPTSFETYSAFKKMLGVSLNSKTGMVDVEVEHFSPSVARNWVTLLIAEINETFRSRDMADAKRNVEYLEKKIAETSIAEMQVVFFGMVEAQIQKLMLAEVGAQYLLREVVPAKEPEVKSSPKRGFILVLAVFLGGIISCIIIIVRSVFTTAHS